MVNLFPSAAIAIALTVAQPYLATAQTSVATTDARIPTFRIEVWADAATEFTVRVDAYVELRRRLESLLPEVTVTDDVGHLTLTRRRLARAIRVARPGAVQGEFFTPAISAQFELVLAGLMDARMWATIMDDNPGSFRHDIDGTYPDEKPLSTVPGIILARLPGLPDDIQFRFVGRHLILYDVRANTIIDRIHDAIRCTNCNNRTGSAAD